MTKTHNKIINALTKILSEDRKEKTKTCFYYLK